MKVLLVVACLLGATTAAHAAPLKLSTVKAAVEKLKDARDSVGELSETQQQRLQLSVERRSKAFETVSNIMKKLSDNQQTIIDNLK